MIRHLLLILALLLLPVPVTATVYTDCTFDSAPSSESNGGVYTCSTGTMELNLYWGTMGGSIFHHETGAQCYGGTGGCAKFFNGTDDSDTIRAMTPGQAGSTTQQNMRFLIKFEVSSVTEYAGKWHEGDVDGWRTWFSFFADRGCGYTDRDITISFNSTSYAVHSGGVLNTGCGYQLCGYPDTWWDTPPLISCTEVTASQFPHQNYYDQWVAVEIERNNQGTYKVYIWTQDGVWNGLYYWLDTDKTSSVTAQRLGPFLELAQTNKYWIVDEVVYADSYIGPPTGFVTGASHKSAIPVVITGGGAQ